MAERMPFFIIDEDKSNTVALKKVIRKIIPNSVVYFAEDGYYACNESGEPIIGCCYPCDCDDDNPHISPAESEVFYSGECTLSSLLAGVGCACADALDNDCDKLVDCEDNQGGENTCANSEVCECITSSESEQISEECCEVLGIYDAVLGGLTTWGTTNSMFQGSCMDSGSAKCERTGEEFQCVVKNTGLAIEYKNYFGDCKEGGKCCGGISNFAFCGSGFVGGGGEINTNSTCGDGIISGDEQCEEPSDCDEGKNCVGCLCVPFSGTCGNGQIEPPEQCESDNDCGEGGICKNCVCTTCGNGVVDSGEECEYDSNCPTGKICKNCVCISTSGVCGDGIIQTPNSEGVYEECDNGTLNSNTLPDACRTNCRNPYCGDGVVDTGEQCESDNDCREGEICRNCNCIRGDLYWADLNGNPIFEAEIGDTIEMVLANAQAFGFSEGDEATFEIYEKDSDEDDPIKTRDNATKASVENNIAIANWTITQEDFNKGWDESEGRKLEFIFKVGDETSGELNVTNYSEKNDPTHLRIIEPKCGSNITVGGKVNITVNISDKDDFVVGEVSIKGIKIGDISNGIFNFSYEVDTPGNVQILATVKDGRKKRTTVVSNIMVIDPSRNGVYSAACINEPRDYTHLTSSHVRFNATSTRAIIVSNGKQTVLNYDNESLKYTWIFSDGTIFSALGNNTSIKPYDFTMIFHPAPGEYDWATLTVEVL